jgi:hypothetical protein
MSFISTQVASATFGPPNPNNMADVIDSLKRLERLGAENSKTIEKLISAAREIEMVIAKLYQASRVNLIQGQEILRRVGPEALQEGIDPQWAARANYHVIWTPVPQLLEPSTNRRVSADRDAALNFASMIANGLLKLLELDLRQRQYVDEKALEVFQSAKTKLGG